MMLMLMLICAGGHAQLALTLTATTAPAAAAAGDHRQWDTCQRGACQPGRAPPQTPHHAALKALHSFSSISTISSVMLRTEALSVSTASSHGHIMHRLWSHAASASWATNQQALQLFYVRH